MNFTLFIIAIIAGLWFLGAFFGFLTGVPKAFKNDTSGQLNAAAIKSQSQESAESTEEKRQQLMDDMKQKISDGYRKL